MRLGASERSRLLGSAGPTPAYENAQHMGYSEYAVTRYVKSWDACGVRLRSSVVAAAASGTAYSVAYLVNEYVAEEESNEAGMLVLIV